MLTNDDAKIIIQCDHEMLLHFKYCRVILIRKTSLEGIYIEYEIKIGIYRLNITKLFLTMK